MTVASVAKFKRILSGDDGRILSTIAVGSASSLAGRLAVPALLPRLIRTWEITPSRAGLAITAAVAAMAISQFVGGRLSDALSRRTILVAALVSFIVGFAVLAVAPVFPVFLLGSAITGVGHGLYLPSAIAKLSELFTADRGTAFGINGASFLLGSAIGPGLVLAAVSLGDWRLTFLPVIVVLAAVLLLVHRWSTEPYVVRGTVGMDLKGTVSRLVTVPPVRRSLIAFALLGFVWQGAINFVPTFLSLGRGFDSTLANVVFAVLFLLAMVANPIAGSLGDRFGCPTVAAGGLLFGLGGLIVAVADVSTVVTIVGVLVFGIGLSSFWPVMDAFVMTRLPDESMAGDFGALNTANLATGSLGPIYVGYVAGVTDYTFAFATLSVWLVATIGVLLLLRRDVTGQ